MIIRRGIANEQHLALEQCERGEQLLRLFYRPTQIILAVYDEQTGMRSGRVAEPGLLTESFRPLPGIPEPIPNLQRWKVAGADRTMTIGHARSEIAQHKRSVCATIQVPMKPP